MFVSYATTPQSVLLTFQWLWLTNTLKWVFNDIG